MKHPFSLRLAAVQHVLSGQAGIAEAARQFKVGRTPLSRWIRAFRQQGETGLEHRPHRFYSAEFKLRVVHYILENRCSSADASALFAIPNETLIQNWLHRYRTKGTVELNPSRAGSAMTKRKQPSEAKPYSEMTHPELLRELEYLRAENAYFKKAESPESGKCAQGAAEKARLVRLLLPEHSLRCLLRAASLPRSSWYYHQAKPASRPDKYAEVIPLMAAIHRQHKECYGYRRMTTELRRRGTRLNHKTVGKLMRRQGLFCQIRRKKYSSWMNDSNQASLNLLARRFRTEESGKKWCTDVTEFRIGQEKLYLSVVQDLFNLEIIAWQMSQKPVLSLTCGMLEQALKAPVRKTGLMLHSDQGWQYRTPMWRSMLADAGVTQSMSRKGNCLDNAVMENFFSHLKVEMYHRNRYDSVNVLMQDIEGYICYFNNERISLKTGMSPVEYRASREM
ncbi:IS3 family transposase [Salmonella enterica]